VLIFQFWLGCELLQVHSLHMVQARLIPGQVCSAGWCTTCHSGHTLKQSLSLTCFVTLDNFPTSLSLGFLICKVASILVLYGYSLDLKCSPKVCVLKTWPQLWHYWEMVEALRGEA
jgi:hypothetical protein